MILSSPSFPSFLSLSPASSSSIFLDRILRDLDAHLHRLQTARETIVALIGPSQAASAQPSFENLAQALPEPETQLSSESQPESQPQPQAQLQVQPEAQPVAPVLDSPPRRRGRPLGSRNRVARSVSLARVPEPRALTSTIPTGPVVVSPAQLARSREAAQLQAERHTAPPPLLEGSLESLLREVEQRRAA